MKKALRLSVMLVALIVAITACNNNAPKLTKYIPKDAAFVAGINAKSITEKLALANMDLDTLVALFSANSHDSTSDDEEKWNELKSSGIDLGAEFYVFGSETNSIMDGKSSTMGAIASLKDAGAFEQYLKKKKPAAETKSAGDYSYMALGDDFVVGWKDKVVILANVHNGKAAPGVYSTGEGTLSQQLLTKLFAQSESESVESVDAFANVEKEQGDIMFYSNVSAGQSGLSAFSISKIGDLVADSYTTGVLNFDNGRVDVKLTGYTGKELGDILKKYPSHEIDASTVNNFPLPVNGFSAFSFNPQVLVEMVKFAGAEQLVNQGLEQYNLTMDDVVKALKGDLAAAVSMDGSMPKLAPGQDSAKMRPKFVINAAIGDKAAYDKVVAALKAKNVEMPQNGTVDIPLMGTIALSVTDKNLVIASDAGILNQYLAGKSKGSSVPADIEEKVKGKSFALYVDVNEIQKTKSQWNLNKTAGWDKKDTSAAIIKDFIATGSKIDGPVVKGEAEIRLLDEKQNSLVTMIKEAFVDKKLGKRFSFRRMADIDNFRILPPLSGLR